MLEMFVNSSETWGIRRSPLCTIVCVFAVIVLPQLTGMCRRNYAEYFHPERSLTATVTAHTIRLLDVHSVDVSFKD